MKPHDRLLARWAETDPDLKTTAETEARVLALEDRTGLSLPGEFRDYLRHGCPADEGSWDDQTCWWPLDRIKPLSIEYEHPLSTPAIAASAAEYLVFADYCIWCMAWAINCGVGPDRGRVIVISGGERFCADSFSEFVARHGEDVWQLL